MDPSSAATGPEYDQAKIKKYIARLRDQQNLGLALAGGAIGAAAGAALWGVITALTNFQIGFEAVGVGFLVGYLVRVLGKGVDKAYGYIGGAFSLLGCAAGNILAVMIAVSNQSGTPLSAVASHMTPQIAWDMLVSNFNPIDLLFYALGLYYGYRSSFHRITADELASLT
jgi:predicted acylesterase/phospholipase RssA